MFNNIFAAGFVKTARNQPDFGATPTHLQSIPADNGI